MYARRARARPQSMVSALAAGVPVQPVVIRPRSQADRAPPGDKDDVACACLRCPPAAPTRWQGRRCTLMRGFLTLYTGARVLCARRRARPKVVRANKPRAPPLAALLQLYIIHNAFNARTLQAQASQHDDYFYKVRVPRTRRGAWRGETESETPPSSSSPGPLLRDRVTCTWTCSRAPQLLSPPQTLGIPPSVPPPSQTRVWAHCARAACRDKWGRCAACRATW